jgi:hypothetical protein
LNWIWPAVATLPVNIPNNIEGAKHARDVREGVIVGQRIAGFDSAEQCL